MFAPSEANANALLYCLIYVGFEIFTLYIVACQHLFKLIWITPL